MSKYDELRKMPDINRLLSQLTPVTEPFIRELTAECPCLPADYSDFLLEVGWGDIGNGGFMLYEGLIDPDDIYDPITAEEVASVKLIGGDYSGINFGFDANDNCSLVFIDASHPEVVPTGKSFDVFIRETIAICLQ